ncbi:hypothetical protein H5410_012748 [Solanum commersonii]|uniref:FBD domain-containing protein n=1 Tax=Solanum commersonii TaxID=4109 RepID=A0A9J6ATI7_SOLCO|nr:hypothetical protein H5410_012748 [Solanum commersonii]
MMLPKITQGGSLSNILDQCMVRIYPCARQIHDPEESIVCLDSHLKSIQLVGFKDEENEIELLRFFLKNARVLEKLTIVWASYALKSEEALKKVLNIPRTSSQVLLTFHDAKLKRKSTNWLDYC